MRTKWAAFIMALLHIATCFFPWVLIASKNIVVSGISAEGTTYGKPGYFSLLLVSLFLLLSFIPKVWALRISLFLLAFNIGWSLRNFVLLSICQGGECPQRQPAFYAYLITSILTLILLFTQKIEVPQQENE